MVGCVGVKGRVSGRTCWVKEGVGVVMVCVG